MKKVLITLLVLLGIAAVAVVTCPDKDAHKDAIQSVINEKLNADLNAADKDNSLGALGASLGSSVSGWLLDKGLNVENHFVYSVGKIHWDGEDKKVSVGVFGHVFTFSKEELEEFLK